MLTGDKFNTALQIATACAMKRPEGTASRLFEVAGNTVEEVGASLDKALAEMKSLDLNDIDVCMITRGDVLPFALDPKNKMKFLDLGLASHSVICCRFAPRQKADVVNLVKSAGKMTLAIGDGGNDVVMIQAAHVGVGIRGKEGLQAARAADYQINHFRYLKRLILVHGHLSHERTAFVGQYSYYKSMLFCFFQITYNFYTGFSGNTMFDSASITLYNVLLFFPIVTFVMDQDLSPENLMKHPSAYKPTAASRNFNVWTYMMWNVRAIFQGFVLFFISLYTYTWEFTATTGGYPQDYDGVGMVVFFGYLWLQTFTLLYELKYITTLHMVIIWFFHILAFAIMIATNYSMTFDSLHPYYATTMAMKNGVLWLTNIVTTVFGLVPVIALRFVKFNYFPSRVDLLRYRYKYDSHQ
jgi:phospholipid-translocating ATPase